MTRRHIRFLVLAVFLVAGGACAVYLSTVLQQRADGMVRYVRVDVWAVQQVEYDVQQFRAAFARHVAGDAGANIAVVQDHFVRARSAISLLRRSPDFEDLRLLADIDRTAGSVIAALDEVARALADRSDFRGDLAVLRGVEDLLAEPAHSLRQLAFDLAHIRLALQDADLASMRWLAGINRWMLIGFFCVAVVFIAFLLTEARTAKRAETLASEARARLAEAIENIDEGFALYDRNDHLSLYNNHLKRFLFGAASPAFEGLPIVDVMRICAETGRVPAAAGRVEEWLQEYEAYHRDPVGVFELQLSAPAGVGG